MMQKNSYFHNPGKQPIMMKTIGEAIDEAAEKWPNREALISYHENKTITFLQLKDQADRLAGGLLKLGLNVGDRLALIGVNSVHWYVAALASAKLGIIVVMLNPGLRTSEIEYCLKKVEAKGVLTDHKFKSQDYPQMLGELAPGIKSSPPGFSPLQCPQLPFLSYIIVATHEHINGCLRLEDVMNLANDLDMLRTVQSRIQPDDPYCIQFSSGTTGLPKAALLSHLRMINDSASLRRRIATDKEYETICCLVPFFHAFGTVVAIVSSLLFGDTIIVAGPIFHKENTLKVIQQYRVDMIYGTPSMYTDLYNSLKMETCSDSQLRKGCFRVGLVGAGGSQVSSELIENLSEVFPNADVIVALGMTETRTGMFSFYRKDSSENQTNTVGCLLDHLEIKIVDEEGKMVPFGTPGEAWVRCCYNFLGYWGDEEKTKEAINNAGWFKTGDILTLREDGYGSIKGRKKYIIIRGGENIFPNEIEDFLDSHPQIVKAQIYGVADEKYGEQVAASLILEPFSNLTESLLKEFCKGKIAHFKIPKYVRFVKHFPMTATGKVQKFFLKESHEKELKQDK